MKKPKGGQGRGARGMSDDDHEIWAGTAATLQPLKRAKGRVLETPVENPRDLGGAAHPARNHSEAGRPHGAHHPAHARVKPGDGVLERLAATPPPPLADFCRRKERKISRGREEIEARIDLHGMRQVEAHTALRRFLASSYERGLSTVLVITGKGAPNRGRDDEHGFLGRPEPGVLRRSVPMWLSDPDLRRIVVSYTTAAIQHGGDGALYIHLRRRGRALD